MKIKVDFADGKISYPQVGSSTVLSETHLYLASLQEDISSSKTENMLGGCKLRCVRQSMRIGRPVSNIHPTAESCRWTHAADLASLSLQDPHPSTAIFQAFTIPVYRT